MISGKLKFKGNFQDKLNKEQRKLKREIIDSKEPEEEKIAVIESKSKEPILVEFLPVPGAGRLITSGATVHGKDTKFMSEMKHGDFIVVQHPTTFEKEEIVASAVLSDKSIALASGFSSDLISYTQYEIRKKPEYRVPDDTVDEKYEKKIQDLSKKIKKEKPVLEYRQKKGMWGYNTIKEKLDKEATREDLLDLRSKKNRDKHCWI